jgi:hypothetical protein
MLILAEAPSYYASTDTTNSPVAAAMPVVSHPTICISGTYKSDTGDTAARSCINCSSTSFCPLGAVYDMDSTSIVSLPQAYAYPRSSDGYI